MIFRIIFFTLVPLLLGACQKKQKLQKIADIPEASGICYSKKSHTLFVVGDDSRVYEIDKNGKILKKAYIYKHDFEGIACDEISSNLLLVDEAKDNILILSQKTLQKISKIKVKKTYKNVTIFKKHHKNNGLEGITIVKNHILLLNQSKKFYPKKNPSVVAIISKDGQKKREILDIIDLHIKDLSGADYHNGFLYIVSDTNNLLIKYDLKKHKIISKLKLPHFSQEGIAIDEDNNFYIADDLGHIYKGEL